MFLALCLLFALPLTAFATDTPISGQESAQTEITYQVPTQYTVYIPAVLDLSYLDGTNSYSFTADMVETQENELVVIRLENELLTMTDSKNHSITGSFYRNDTNSAIAQYGNVAEFSDGETTSSFGIYFVKGIDSELHSGTYSGTATFSITTEYREG